MAVTLSRRNLMQGTAAAAAGGLLPGLIPSALAQTATPLNTTTRTLEVKGKSATVLGVLQDNGLSGLFLDPGQRFIVDVVNKLNEDTIIHWHGQTPPVQDDGVAMTGEEKLIGPGTTRRYEYEPRPGTYWMHSHQGLQEMQLLAGPLIVRTAEDLKQDAQEVVVMLHDFTFKSPEEVMKEVTGGAAMASMSDDTPASGSKAAAPAAAGAMPGMSGGAMAGGSMPGGSMPGMSGSATSGSGGQMPAMGAMPAGSAGAMPGMASGAKPAAMAMKMGSDGKPDLNDFDYDAYLANDRTLDDPMVVRTERHGRVRLRVINAGASTVFWLELDGADGTLIGVDGEQVHPIRGRRFPIAEAQRLDIMIDVPAGKVVPVLAQREGDRVRTGIILAAPGARVEKIQNWRRRRPNRWGSRSRSACRPSSRLPRAKWTARSLSC